MPEDCVLESSHDNLTSTDTNRPKVAVLGAGLLGRMLTVSIMDDCQVSLFDKDSGDAKQSAGYLAAAMLAPLAESADCSAGIMQLGERALGIWPKFIAKLDEPVFFQQQGSLIVAFDQDMAAFEQFQSRLKGNNLLEVGARQIAEIEPDLMQRFHKGLYLPKEGQLDNRQLLLAMANKIRKANSVNWQTGVKVEVKEDSHDKQVLVDGIQLAGFDWVVDCRGIGAKTDIKTSDAQLRGVRGEVVRVYAPDVTLTRPVRLMHPRYPIYIAPKENHHFVIGATQVESEDTRKPTVRSALELLSACFSVHSGFAEAEIISIDAGLRPAYLDNEPRIFQDKHFISLNGLYRHGYLLAPVIVEECIKLMQKSIKAELDDHAIVLRSFDEVNASHQDVLPGLVVSANECSEKDKAT